MGKAPSGELSCPCDRSCCYFPCISILNCVFQGPFDVCRKVFVGGEETSKMTIHDKSDLFFHDYSIAPLFVQENYVNVIPYAAR